LKEGNYSAARGVLELWRSRFPGLAAAAVAEWQWRFEAAATRQLDEAVRLVQQKHYIAARRAVGKARDVWPTLAAATNMLDRIQREYPFITVGVLETAPRQPTDRFDDWAAIRASRLTEPLLTHQVGFSADGGVYHSPYAELVLDDTGRELSLKLTSTIPATAHAGLPLTPDNISRYLLSLADPDSQHFRSDFASLLAGVSLAPDGAVRIHFTRAHVRPESLLQLPLPPTANGQSQPATTASAFSMAEFTPNQVVFAANSRPGTTSALKAIVEEKMADDDAAVSALLAGEVDVLDRVPPWYIERLRAVKDIRVEAYCLPTVHVLVPNLSRPLIAKREFRRALCFGIDRKSIVQRVLLGGAVLPGFEVLSGPFPAGVSLSDPVRYGYNSQIAPRPFEPRLATILATIAWAGVQNSTGDNAAEPTDIPELVLAHPSDPVIRVACQAIEAQLERGGIRIKLQEFSADELLAGRVDCDLRYAELAVWEPVTDARRVMELGQQAGDIASQYVESALRKLDEASNWADVRARLAALHEIAHHELPVIPLWQTANYFAYRASLRGIGEAPMTLYQNVNQWQPTMGGNVARLDRGR
jgi:ABC-type transport system substrate-binding protein